VDAFASGRSLWSVWPTGNNDGVARPSVTILHLDLDAFFAAVEQRDKPSLRGKPVVVGGIGARGVVATASYEARAFGVRSAMRTIEARSLCPHAAFLTGRFAAYREASQLVMDRLRRESPLVEPLSLDEAYVDLAASPEPPTDTDIHLRVDQLRADIADLTGGLTASVGVASSKLMAKIASEINKPNGVYVVQPGTEAALLGPMQVTVIPGVGPATTERLRRLGVATVDDLRAIAEDDLVRTLGSAHGTSLWRLARAIDTRPVVAERETKSLSVEDTFDHDITDRSTLSSIVDAMSRRVAARLQRNGWSARTVTLKARRHDFETLSRSSTFVAPTDSATALADTAERLLAGIDVAGGLRLLGVGVSGLSDWVQPDLFESPEPSPPEPDEDELHTQPREVTRPLHWLPGTDVHHSEHGDGWVWGSGLGRVTVRFETRDTPPGPVMTFADDDPDLTIRVVEIASPHE
jgi:DNA polymerase-4